MRNAECGIKVALTRIKDEILRVAQDDKRKYTRINNFLVILNKRGTRAVKNLNLYADIFPERGQRG